MLCEFWVYSSVIQLSIYMYLFFFKFFSQLGCSRILSRVPIVIPIVWLKKLNLREPKGHTQVPTKRKWWGPDFHPGSLIVELAPLAIMCAASLSRDKHEARNHVLSLFLITTL